MAKKIKLNFPLTDYQEEIHKLVMDKKSQFSIVLALRQVGKSAIIKVELLNAALTKKGSESYSLSPVREQSRKLYKELKETLIETNLLTRWNDTRLELEFFNGSIIYFKSAAQKESLQGITVSGILTIDEAYNIPDDIFYYILPSLNVNKAPCLIVSTPRFKTGFFHKFYMYGLNGTNRSRSINITEYDTSMFLSEETLEMYRKMYPKNQFMTEYLGQFIDGESLVFGDFSNCVIDRIKYTSQDLYVGIDWANGGGGDYTSISVLTGNKEQFGRWSWNNISPLKQIDKIVELLGPYQHRIKVIQVEKNSMGDVYYDLLKNRLTELGWKARVAPFITTNKSKSEIIENLQVAFQNNDIQLLKDTTQTNELTYYEAKVNPKTNVVSYNAPSGKHDDSVISLCLSLDAITNTYGQYAYN